MQPELVLDDDAFIASRPVNVCQVDWQGGNRVYENQVKLSRLKESEYYLAIDCEAVSKLSLECGSLLSCTFVGTVYTNTEGKCRRARALGPVPVRVTVICATARGMQRYSYLLSNQRKALAFQLQTVYDRYT